MLCIAFPASRNRTEECGLDLYRVDGKDFPEFSYKGSTIPARKDHNVGGSKDGWVIVGGWERFAQSSTAWKVEGIPDALALAPLIPRDHVVVTNIGGCKGAAKCVPSIYRGKIVNVIGDADDPGQEGARKFAEAISQYASDVRRVRLPFSVEKTQGKDVRDYLSEGGTFTELLGFAE